LPSQFGGVQLDADHSVEYAEVTEMTQLISALIQRGYSKDIVRGIYQDIGETIVESVSDFNEALNSSDKNAVYRILGKALLESFAKGDKDAIGLAKTFVSIAQQFLNEENIKFKIPFSAATVYPQFLSVVTSNLVKSGIRRKYSGLISVLVPSHGMIQYFELDGQKYEYSELFDIISKKGVRGYIVTESGFTPVSDADAMQYVAKNDPNFVSALESAFNDEQIFMEQNGSMVLTNNPFIQQNVHKTEVTFGDYVQVYDTTTGEEIYNGTVETFEQRDKIRSAISENILINKFLLKPKNLKASDLTFEYDGKTYSAYDLDIVRALHYIKAAIRKYKIKGNITPRSILKYLPDEQKAVIG
jgi:hypothetical protein